MKYALIFWWVSLAAAPSTATLSSIGPNGVENVVGGIHQEGVRLFATADECTVVQTAEEKKHVDDVKLWSVCASADRVFMFNFDPQHR